MAAVKEMLEAWKKAVKERDELLKKAYEENKKLKYQVKELEDQVKALGEPPAAPKSEETGKEVQ
ncbi:hypothetical protein COT20_00020 [bacterium (Candidatus Gribaldobacteria) CG08_land_8_20_14_0_20_39_15]|uniref:Uncharacterized protein n=1 Tax=bacterium (Candidatus Gribaldobacteria) CG08_land_8_20_14_0_20_39_15 TaxID=2014273 RepID=A0A2M6XVD9_9BACT|nr:MAG: hypothetical protein COT20_00020 [bacterium (Candidatus Gribaldobacteria) CG08_land_8_20_14_0_20_39_15]